MTDDLQPNNDIDQQNQYTDDPLSNESYIKPNIYNNNFVNDQREVLNPISQVTKEKMKWKRPLIIFGVLVVTIGVIGGAGWYLLRHNISSSVSEPSAPIPANIIEESEQIVVSKVGKEFFNKYYSLDKSNSKYSPADELCIEDPESCVEYLQKPYYNIAYSFKIPGKSFINEQVSVLLDENGSAINGYETAGIPNCVKDSIECEFPIDKEKAIAIAKNAGLEKNVNDWEIAFHWRYKDPETYVWNIKNTLTENSGQLILIDANTGTIISNSGWGSVE